MNMKHAEQRHMTTQYVVSDGQEEFHITEIVGGQEWDFVFVYADDDICIARFRICVVSRSPWYGDIWFHDIYFSQEKVKEIAEFITQQHANNNAILKESLK